MDYISRDDAIDCVLGQYCASSDETEEALGNAIEEIKKRPAADVVEVIRCKDCKYFSLDKWGKVNDIPLIVAHEICDFWGEGCKTDKDAYCSFAERRG